jgi:hypothetical protein
VQNFNYRWQLWKLQRLRASISRAGDKRYAEAKKSGASHDQLERVYSDERLELELVDDDINLLETRYLREETQRLLLADPQFTIEDKGGPWKQSHISGRYFLNSDGIAQLRASIRKEKRERREAAVFWVAAVTGIIGALTGLASVLMK